MSPKPVLPSSRCGRACRRCASRSTSRRRRRRRAPSHVRAMGAIVFGMTYRLLGDRQAAEECTQDVFVSVWRTARNYQPERARVSTWLLRSRATAPSTQPGDEQRGPSTLTRRSGRPTSRPIRRTSFCRGRRRTRRRGDGGAPDAQREALSLAYFDGLSHAEIAERLRLPVGTVKGRIRLALDRPAQSHRGTHSKRRPRHERPAPRSSRRRGTRCTRPLRTWPSSRRRSSAIPRSPRSSTATGQRSPCSSPRSRARPSHDLFAGIWAEIGRSWPVAWKRPERRWSWRLALPAFTVGRRRPLPCSPSRSPSTRAAHPSSRRRRRGRRNA